MPLPDTALALGAESRAPGLLAVGGTLEVHRLLEAYSKGVFPWYSRGEPVLWWAPDPRMVLPVAEFKLHRSLKQAIRHFMGRPGAEIRMDSNFETVIEACARVERHGQDGTWIVPELIGAYCQWHRQGQVHSVETWIDGELVGGLYGVCLGRMFFGESMFALRTDASKLALAALVGFCRAHGVEMIDCQQATTHLASLGARPLSRASFETHLRQAIARDPIRTWEFHPDYWAELGVDRA